jgi:hypothetical protein
MLGFIDRKGWRGTPASWEIAVGFHIERYNKRFDNGMRESGRIISIGSGLATRAGFPGRRLRMSRAP